MTIDSDRSLIDLLLVAIKSTVLKLNETGESFYYYALLTTGEGHPPVLSAWSKEALHRVASDSDDYKQAEYDLKWSASDSPYYASCQEYWKEVEDYVNDQMTDAGDLDEEQWLLLINSMAESLRISDENNVFSGTSNRNDIFINAEVIPPDEGNEMRAKMLNPPSSFTWWTKEMEEEL